MAKNNGKGGKGKGKGGKGGKPAAAKPAAAKPAAEVAVNPALNGKPAAGKGKEVKPAAKPAVPVGVKKVKNAAGVPVETKLAANGMFASVRIFGYPLAQVLRTMGRAEFTSSEARGIMDSLNLEAVRINTIRDKIGEGRNGEEVKYAALSKKELATLKELIPADAAE